jgi:hypothetical protein
MLYLRKPRLDTLEDLRACLQKAIELEHATIPPYLTALYSIKEGALPEIAALLRGIVTQEMLHLSLAANVLNAIGGHPVLNTPGFLPTYPGPLPMGIGSEPGQPFIVHLRRLSLELIEDTFMVIEEPETPLVFPVGGLAAALPEYRTLGQFYESLKDKLDELGPRIFTGRKDRQVTGWFARDELFAVKDVVSAKRALDLIVAQGEGSRTSPLGPEGQPAHYYRFAELRHGRRLVPDASVPEGYSYSGEPIPFDAAGVLPMGDDPGAQEYPVGSEAWRLAERFDATYSSLLNALHLTFNGEPGSLNPAIGLMFSLRVQVAQLMTTPVPGTGFTAGPRFRYSRVPSNA